jgi:nucleotide-binding universal stress UspA family protein
MTDQHTRPSDTMRTADVANGENLELDDRYDAAGRKRPTVLVAVDESEHSIRVATAARNLFGYDAHFLVVSVGEPTVALWGGEPLAWGVSYPVVPAGGPMGYPFVPVAATATIPDPDMPGAGMTAVDVAQRNAEDVVRAANLSDAEPVGDVGDPSQRILAIAEEQAADVIVVGTHHRNWLSRLFSSSVSTDVLKAAERPVLVVP